METLTHSLNYEQPQELHFDKYAQHILENSRNYNLADTTTISLAASPKINEIADTSSQLANEFFKRIGASLIHSIQLQSLPKTNARDSPAAAVAAASVNDMDLDFGPHHLVMDSHNYNNAMDELQKQLDYDKFMNEVWIGVVLTLIMISMIFCFCSCFLYHQFRTWKRNYRTTVTQSSDVESVRLNTDLEDPVPEYTLVSGLPSYESALEILQKDPQSCLMVHHPSVFEVFNKNEKPANENSTKSDAVDSAQVSRPLLGDDASKSVLPSYDEATTPITTTAPVLTYNHSLASLLSLATQKSSQCKSSKSANVSPTTTEAEKQFKA